MESISSIHSKNASRISAKLNFSINVQKYLTFHHSLLTLSLRANCQQ